MSEIKLKPLGDRIIIEPQEAEDKTASGIIIPDSAKEKPQKGTVVAVGPGKKDEKIELKAGDVVLYGKYSGTELNYNNKDYLIMKQEDVLVIIP
jgi:chaperonin GroES